MAYKTKELEKQALEAIEKYKLFFIEDIVSYLPCDKKTFYNHNLHEFPTIKEALLKVKTDLKVSMRSKWYKSNTPVLQLSLMKLICTDLEREKLSMQHSKIEVVDSLSDEERERRIYEIQQKLKGDK
tara:strand:+ start:145 stop:525 length:381 start_codon:yes stop_codon:yes gene_type:complete